jgi:hypothetical protein
VVHFLRLDVGHRSGLGNDVDVSSLPVLLILFIFVCAAGVTWVAGVQLSKCTDELDRRLGLGDAIGGMVLLAIAGSLPELAVTISAAKSGHLGLAAGNLIGGIATATMVLVICDLFANRPLTYLVGSLLPVLEGLLVVLIVSVVLMGALLPTSVRIAGRISPAGHRVALDRRGVGPQSSSGSSEVESIHGGRSAGATTSPRPSSSRGRGERSALDSARCDNIQRFVDRDANGWRHSRSEW